MLVQAWVLSGPPLLGMDRRAIWIATGNNLALLQSGRGMSPRIGRPPVPSSYISIS